MFRIRRSRVFLILAVFAVIILYHFTSFGDLGDVTRRNSVEISKSLASKDTKDSTTSTHPTKGTAASSGSTANQDAISKNFTNEDSSSDRGGLDEIPDKPTSRIESAPSVKDIAEDSDAPISKEPPPPSRAQVVEEQTGLKNITRADGEPAAVAEKPAEPVLETPPEAYGQGRFEVIANEDDDSQKIHWSQLPEHFPIPTKSLIPLPTGKPKAIPKIQYSNFLNETLDSQTAREAKLDEIRKTFAFSWDGYRKNAWMQDELSPVSGNYRNPFCGWAATLVDSLDSLWILGMRKEFDEAAEAVGKIDFTTSIRNDLPLFEVTIRYLGGLVAAYDLSGHKYKILLDKAVELAEVLMGAFDTPNRMPMTFYLWKPTFASQPHRAKTRVVLAEIGSLSMEFTRLAQITKETKYYDAIARITNEFEKLQDNTKIPGLWPKQIDASGCKKADPVYIAPTSTYAHDGASLLNEQRPQIPGPKDPAPPGKRVDNEPSKLKRDLEDSSDISAAYPRTRKENRRVLEDGDLSTPTPKPKPDCVPQGLNSPPGGSWEDFTIGGMADSVYEYLPKEYMLLGGLEEKYRTMYEKAVEAVRKHLLFRPMIEDEKRNLLVAATVSTSGKPDNARDPKRKPELSHLGCFAGGMFAVGAKVFDRKDDLDIAKRLTDGCVWAYEMTPTGIMPEHFLVVPCDDMKECPFNQTLWYENLDPYHPRSTTRTSGSQTVLQDEEERFSESANARGGSLESSAAAGPSATKKDSEQDQTSTPAALGKRQLGEIENDKPIQTIKATNDGGESMAVEVKKGSHEEGDGDAKAAKGIAGEPKTEETPIPTTTENAAEPVLPVVEAYTPPPIPSQEEYALGRIKDEKLPKGVTKITGRKYILRPEAVESVFIMYRVTGDDYWREKGWKMFTSIQNATRAEFGASAISDVMSATPYPVDEMESFWLAETLKYLYLLFSQPNYYSLDDYVLYDILPTSP
ncbi:MAG: hypothetical protein Q9182_007108 [Xanthomendoza sp. 2 TL-2023]